MILLRINRVILLLSFICILIQGLSRRSEEIEKLWKVLPSDDLSKVVNKNYTKKFLYRCENLVTETLLKCQNVFQNARDKCVENTIFVLRYFCDYIDIKDVCGLKNLFGSDNVCRPKNVIPAQLGQTYAFLQNSKNKLKSEFQEIKFHYKITEVAQDAKKIAKDMSGTVKVIVDQYSEKKGWLKSFTAFIVRIAAFSFLFIIFSCHNYISNYLTDVEEDNMYITWYFRKIDYRRYIKGKFTLLPLKSGEKRDLSDVYQIYLTTAEKAEFLHAVIGTLLMFFFTILFISIDLLLYNILDDIRTHGNISYEQIGHHDLSLEIKGVGFLASMLRSIAHNFVVKKRVKQYSTNEACLPNPSVPGAYNIKIFASFFLLFMLSWMNVYVLKRLCRYVCSLFYPKAEKKRVIFLYNQTLKKRITYLNYRLDIVRREAREKKIPEPLTFPLALRIKHPKLFSWLLYFNQGRRSCLICHELEPKSGGENHCKSIHCYFYYCNQCWDIVVRKKCIGCPKYIDTAPLAEEV
ncbi:protein sneaky-like [Planococcus citri]|uniref:protein sneaky-like n=1 Tax=Planococcus citri TaxID=170843 RepID=UPI0031F7631C